MATSPTMRNIPSYGDITTKMQEYISNPANPMSTRMNAIRWQVEFSEGNYTRCKEMMELFIGDGLPFVDNIDDYCELYDDPSVEVPLADAKKEIIKSIGRIIHREGGMDALLACFYIMLNFMTAPHDFVLKFIIKDLDTIWDGIGEWS